MKVSRLALLGIGLLTVGLCTGCNKLKARDQLNKGVLAFQNAQFPQAVDHFQQAVSLQPDYVNARLFLATALASQYQPGAAGADNIKMGNEAIQAYENVLKLDPKNTNALGSIASIYYNMHNFDKAKEFQLQLMKLQPNNPDPYYWIGVLNWFPCWQRQTEMRRDLKLNVPKDPTNPMSVPPLPKKAREALAEKNEALVDEGIQSLQKAIDLKPNYANAYSYLDLMYIQKADLESDEDARQADLKKASDLATKAVALMKAQAQAKARQPSS